MNSLREKLFGILEEKIVHFSYKKTIPISMNLLFPSERKRITHFNNLIKYNGIVDFHSRRWSMDLFKEQSIPLVTGTFDNTFGRYENRGNYLWVMDLPIKMPRTNIRIPYELDQFREFILKSFTHEALTNPHINDWFAYLCVDQRLAFPGSSQRRPGAHSDSFPTGNINMDRLSDSIYLGYTSLPTEFCIGNFAFNNNIDTSNNTQILDHFDKNTISVKTFNPYHIIKMDSGHVHRASINNDKYPIDRTFVKLTFSPDIFNRVGNDHNYLFNYDWPLYGRTIERNNSSITGGYMNDAEYEFVDYADCNNIFCNEKNIIRLKRKGKIYITPAIEGELLATRSRKVNINNSQMMSCFVAKKNSWKVFNPVTKVEYFVDTKKLSEFYDTTNISCGKPLYPKPNIYILATKINKNIRIIPPWGGFQYLHVGDYLIKRHNNEIYGVTNDDIIMNYDNV